MNVLPPSADGWKIEAGMYLQNVGIHLQDYIVRSQSEHSLPRKAENLYPSMILITDNKNILILGF